MITKLKANLFQNLSNCENLILDGNQITEIEPGAFNGLVKLKKLHLNRNQLILKPAIFNGLAKLKELRLEQNELESLEPETFSGLSSLTHLSLDRNKLTFLEPGIFSGLSSLTSLSLDDNKLTTIDAGPFKDLPRPLSLSLRDNPLVCNNSLCWLKEEYKMKNITWFLPPTCSSGIHFYTWKTCPGESYKIFCIGTTC